MCFGENSNGGIKETCQTLFLNHYKHCISITTMPMVNKTGRKMTYLEATLIYKVTLTFKKEVL